MNKRGMIKKAVVPIIVIAALAFVGVLYILKSGAPSLEQLVEGEYSHIYDESVRKRVEDAFAQRPDELEWVWWDANLDGEDDLILQENTLCADGMKRIQGVFCVSDKKIICVMWDDVDVTEFYSVCNNKLVYYSQYLGTYTQKVYEVCEYDGDWNREAVSGLEFFYIENMTEMPADWTTEHPDMQAEGAYYQKFSVEENGEKVYTSLTLQEWCEEFEKLLGLPAPVGSNLFVTKCTYEVKNITTDVEIQYPKLTGFEDNAKENRINSLIEDDAKRLMDSLLQTEWLEESQLCVWLDCEITYLNDDLLSIFYTGQYGFIVPAQGPDAVAMATTIDLEKEEILNLKDIITDLSGMEQMLLNDEFENISVWDGEISTLRISQEYGGEAKELLTEGLQSDGTEAKRNIEWYIKDNNLVIVSLRSYYNEYAASLSQVQNLMTEEFLMKVGEGNIFTVTSYAENCNLYEDAGAEQAFSETLITELSQVLSDGTVATFCDLHKADYKILTADEINAYIEKDQILYSFFAESKEESAWYEIALETAKDIVVCGEEYQYKFANAGRGVDPGIPLYGQAFYFVAWENANYIVSISEDNKVYVHLFDNIVVGNVAVLEEAEDTVAVEYYRYETDSGVASNIELEVAEGYDVSSAKLEGITYPQVCNMEDKELENRINESLAYVFTHVIAADLDRISYFSDMPIIMFQNDEYLSLKTIIYYTNPNVGGGRLVSFPIYQTVSIRTGELLDLDDFVEVSDEFVQYLLDSPEAILSVKDDDIDEVWNEALDVRIRAYIKEEISAEEMSQYFEEANTDYDTENYFNKCAFYLTEGEMNIVHATNVVDLPNYFKIRLDVDDIEEYLKVPKWQREFVRS